jgi:hypothetical protein
MKKIRGAVRLGVGLVLLLSAVSSWRPAIAADGPPLWPFSNLERFPDGLYQSLSAKRLIMLGEVHGTNEAPGTVYGLVSLWRRHGRQVAVALEWPEALQKDVDAALRSGDLDALAAHPFFRRKQQDGRTSTAMVELIGRLAKLDRVPVVCIDPDEADTAQARDTAMAKQLTLGVRSHPGATVIALMGNWHAQRRKVAAKSPPFRPCGYEVTRMPKGALPGADVVALSLESAGGTAWVMTSRRTGVNSVPLRRTRVSQQAGGQPYVRLFGKIQEGYDGRIFTRYRTASLPFVEPETASRKGESGIVPF